MIQSESLTIEEALKRELNQVEKKFDAIYNDLDLLSQASRIGKAIKFSSGRDRVVFRQCDASVLGTAWFNLNTLKVNNKCYELLNNGKNKKSASLVDLLHQIG